LIRNWDLETTLDIEWSHAIAPGANIALVLATDTGIGGTSLALNSDNTIAFQTGWGTNLTEIADTVALGSFPVVPPLKVLGSGYNPGFFLGFQYGAGGGCKRCFSQAIVPE
jgi:hypothetical protein